MQGDNNTWENYTVQGQKTVTAHFLNEQILPFGFAMLAEQHYVNTYSTYMTSHACKHITAIVGCRTIVGLMLGQRRRRWPNIRPTLVQHPVFAGILLLV